MQGIRNVPDADGEGDLDDAAARRGDGAGAERDLARLHARVLDQHVGGGAVEGEVRADRDARAAGRADDAPAVTEGLGLGLGPGLRLGLGLELGVV